MIEISLNPLFMATATSTNASLGIHNTQSETLTLRDNRTGQVHEIPIRNNAVQAIDFQAITIDARTTGSRDNGGLRVLDPGFRNTAVIESSVSEMYVFNTFRSFDSSLMLVQRRGTRSNALSRSFRGRTLSTRRFRRSRLSSYMGQVSISRREA